LRWTLLIGALRGTLLLARTETLCARQLALLALLWRALLLLRPRGLGVLIALLARIEALRVGQLALLVLPWRALLLLRPRGLRALIALLAWIDALRVG
jgi:hypothetical protein